MERPFPIEYLVDRFGNRYAIVVAVAKRARQLKAGAKPFIDIGSNNPTTIALHEIAAGYVSIEDPLPPSEKKKTQTPDDVAEALALSISELGSEEYEPVAGISEIGDDDYDGPDADDDDDDLDDDDSDDDDDDDA